MPSVAMKYLASLSLLFLGIGLLAVQLPLLDRWGENVGQYAARSASDAGPCANAYAMPDGAGRAAAIAANCDRMAEPWQFLPWGLALGLVVATLAIAWPWTYYRETG